MKTSLRIALLLPAVGMLAFTHTTNAASTAGDNASNVPYDDGWQNGDNGGFGFSAWTLNTTGGVAGRFIGNSTGLASPGANINVGGESFGMYGASASQSNALRDFTGSLSVGQTFSIQLAVNFRNGFKGIDLLATSTPIFTFNTVGDDYVVSNATTGNGSIGNAYSDNTAFAVSVTQTSAGGGTWSIIRSGGVSDSDSGTYTGVATGFKLFVGNTDGGSPNDFFSNSMTVSAVPESSTWGALMGALAALLVFRRIRTRARLH
ncbi:MAG: PEP-CTERM sorting domain-containing protein [Chthoniobacterales bacterium]